MPSSSFHIPRLSRLSRFFLATLGLPLFAGLGLHLAAAGEFTASTSDKAPTEHVIESIAPESDGNFRWFALPQSNRPNTERNFAQTFRAPGSASSAATNLHGLAIQVASIDKAVGDGARNAVFKVALFEGSVPPEAMDTQPLYTATGRLPEAIGSGDYLTLQFDREVELSGGSNYSLVFIFETIAEEQWINLSAGGSSSYPQGQAYFLSNDQAGAAPTWKISHCDLKLLLLSAP